MPWKLVGFIICLTLGTCFAGFNLGNSCNISFGFKTFENVPIFFSLVVAFVLGVLVTLPFTVIKKKSAKDKREQAKEDKVAKRAARKELKAGKQMTVRSPAGTVSSGALCSNDGGPAISSGG